MAAVALPVSGPSEAAVHLVRRLFLLRVYVRVVASYAGDLADDKPQPLAVFVRRLPRFDPIVCWATFINPRKASLTEASSGKAAATSGLKSTRFVPFLYSAKYLPRTPLPKSSRLYSFRISSDLTVLIYFPFVPRCVSCAYYPCPSTALGMGNYQ